MTENLSKMEMKEKYYIFMKCVVQFIHLSLGIRLLVLLVLLVFAIPCPLSPLILLLCILYIPFYIFLH